MVQLRGLDSSWSKRTIVALAVASWRAVVVYESQCIARAFRVTGLYPLDTDIWLRDNWVSSSVLINAKTDVLDGKPSTLRQQDWDAARKCLEDVEEVLSNSVLNIIEKVAKLGLIITRSDVGSAAIVSDTVGMLFCVCVVPLLRQSHVNVSCVVFGYNTSLRFAACS